MASLVLGVAGAAALGPYGFALEGFAGISGAQIGWTLGSFAGSMLGPGLPDIHGPTLSDTSVQSNTYGNMREIRYGTNRMTCKNMLWSTEKIPTEHTQSAGGKGGPSQDTITTTYSMSFVVGLGDVGPLGIAGVRRIWLNKNLVLDRSDSNTGFTGKSGGITVRSGAWDQLPSALMEAHLGVGNVPGYRGTPTIEFENLELAPYGNNPPLVEAEVVEVGTESMGLVTVLNHNTGYTPFPTSPIYGDTVMVFKSVYSGSGGIYNSYLGLMDMATGTVTPLYSGPNSLEYYETPCFIGSIMIDNVLTIVNELWIPGDPYTTSIYIHDSDTGQFKEKIPSPSTFSGHIEFCEYLGMPFVCTTTTSGILYFYDVLARSIVFNFDNPCNGSKLYAHHANSKYFAVAGCDTIYIYDLDSKIQVLESSVTGLCSMTYDSKRDQFVVVSNYSGGTSTFTVIDPSLTVTTLTGITTVLPISVLQYVESDDIYLSLGSSPGNEQRDIRDPETFASLYSAGNVSPYWIGPLHTDFYIDLQNGSTLVWDVNDLSFVPYETRLTPGTTYLYEIVSDICGKVDLNAGDIDVTQLTDTVNGYMLSQQMTARAAIEGLQPAFFFDAVESD